MPGEGPALKGRATASGPWKQATVPPQHANSDGHNLVNADSLKCAFRKRAIARLRWLRKKGKLKLGGKFQSLRSDENWEALIDKLQRTPFTHCHSTAFTLVALHSLRRVYSERLLHLSFCSLFLAYSAKVRAWLSEQLLPSR